MKKIETLRNDLNEMLNTLSGYAVTFEDTKFSKRFEKLEAIFDNDNATETDIEKAIEKAKALEDDILDATPETETEKATKKATKKQAFRFVTYEDIKPEKINFDDVKINDIIGVRFDTIARNNFIKSGVMYDENNPEFYPEFENGVDFCKVIKKTSPKAKNQFIDVQSIKTGVILRYFPENFENFIGDDNLSFRVYQVA